MFALYLFALVLGGGLLLFSVLGEALGAAGGADGDIDLGGVDGDVGDLDLGGEGLDADLADGADTHAGADGAFKILTLRTGTYFLFGFGAAGTLLSLFSEGGLLTAAVALGTGVFLALLVAAVFRYLAVSESGQREEGEEAFVGLPAQVTLPLSPGHRGKVVVRTGERSYELMARPFDGAAAGAEAWRQVVVVEMEQGTALVAPLEELSGLPPGAETRS